MSDTPEHLRCQGYVENEHIYLFYFDVYSDFDYEKQAHVAIYILPLQKDGHPVESVFVNVPEHLHGYKMSEGFHSRFYSDYMTKEEHDFCRKDMKTCLTLHML